jgi:hypothetical protein
VPEAPVAETVVVEPPPVIEPAPEVTVAAAEEPALPSFMGPSGAKGSLAAECDAVAVQTVANGGMATAEGMRDASFALGEQFCLARTFAMAKSDELTAQVQGYSPEQVAEQCAAFGPVLKEHVASLSLKPAAEVLSGVEGFVLSSGMSPAQLSGTAKVCLGVGYARDDMDVAIGSALLLAAMGERGYSEYLGHHLSQGFGATERPDLAMDWYQMSLDAMEQGQMVVAPGMAGRDALIRKASYTLNGRAAELEPEEATVQEAALPVFTVVPQPDPVEELAVRISDELEAVEEPATPVVVAIDPVTAPVVVAPEVAGLAEAAPLPVAVAETQPDTSIVNAGAQAAIMAARLPFLVFSSY